MIKFYNIIFVVITLLAIYLRFANLNWGAPYYFHPDERNIASSVAGIQFPIQLNPHFFAYGSLPIYCIYLIGVLTNIVLHNSIITSVSFEMAIIIGRFFSAFFSCMLIFLIYKIAIMLTNKKTGFVVFFLTAFCVGLIQYAHFATFEMWLTFFCLLLLYQCCLFINDGSKKRILFIGLTLGILIATKISSLSLLPLPMLTIIFSKNHQKNYSIFLKNLIVLITAVIVFILTNPYALIDFYSFQNSMHYESSVAIGTLPVFYTQAFQGTTPIIFQLTHIFPFLIGLPLTLFFIVALLFCVKLWYQKKDHYILITITAFFLLFIPQAFLFAKWTRYMVPVIPPIILIIGFFLSKILNKKYYPTIAITLCLLSLFISLSFVYLVYMMSDTRVQAASAAKKMLSPNDIILSEVYDLGILPFNSNFTAIHLFNFYDLDSDITLSAELNTQINNTQYIIVPSQRIMGPRLKNPSLFPISSTFYKKLQSDTSAFRRIYQTPCQILCQIVYNFGYIEETARVFDRPTVFIYKKLYD